MREFIESEIFINETGLYLQLIDSSFHRLLIHAACQFHNLKSKVIIIVTIFTININIHAYFDYIYMYM